MAGLSQGRFRRPAEALAVNGQDLLPGLTERRGETGKRTPEGFRVGQSKKPRERVVARSGVVVDQSRQGLFALMREQ